MKKSEFKLLIAISPILVSFMIVWVLITRDCPAFGIALIAAPIIGYYWERLSNVISENIWNKFMEKKK